MADNHRHLAEAVRAACLEAALDAYEDAGIRGLCHEGRWECAMQAIRNLDLDAVRRETMNPDPPSGSNAVES